jgi:hypothetical protein
MEETNNKKKLIIGIIIGLLLVGLIGGFIYLKKRSITIGEITTFEGCSKAGYPILETYPRQCQMPDGRTFSEKIEVATPMPEEICENLCGDGICQEIVCLGSGCPCLETAENCPIDCEKGVEYPLIK